MKIKVITIALVMAGLNSVATHAETNVNVHGVIEPKACSAMIAAGGMDLDWGTMSHDELKQDAFTTLDKKPFTLQVSCPDDAKMALWMVDPNAATAMKGKDIDSHTGHDDMSRAFGLGLDPVTNKKLGNFVIDPIKTTVDGVVNESHFGFQPSDSHKGTTFTPANMQSWSYSQNDDWTVWDETKSLPATGKNFLWEFNVEPQLNLGTEISSTQRVDWQGTAQINVRYF